MTRRTKGWRSDSVRICSFCGRILEPWEVCECTSKLPKDGLRAKCPAFKARASYRGDHYIVCTSKKLFPSREQRDQYYVNTCCRDCSGCYRREQNQ